MAMGVSNVRFKIVQLKIRQPLYGHAVACRQKLFPLYFNHGRMSLQRSEAVLHVSFQGYTVRVVQMSSPDLW